jgi:hypothetical protein
MYTNSIAKFVVAVQKLQSKKYRLKLYRIAYIEIHTQRIRIDWPSGLERLNANVKVTSVLCSIPASSDTKEYGGGYKALPNKVPVPGIILGKK